MKARGRRLHSALMAIAAVTVMPAAAGAQTSAANELAARLLVAHNRERVRVGVPPLRWDPALAGAAASWARSLSGIDRLRHSPRAVRPGQSENLSMGTRGHYSPEQLVGFWIAERADFRPGIFPNVSRTGNWFDVSHYTQMIWPGTTRLGCAIYRDRRNDFLVCRYAPRGNIDGRRVPW